MNGQLKKELKIRTGVVTRLRKELASYIKEYAAQEKRIQALIDQNKDEHDVRKQREVLEETNVMIPDCKNRLEAAVRVLEDLVAQVQQSEEEEFQNAVKLLNEVESQ